MASVPSDGIGTISSLHLDSGIRISNLVHFDSMVDAIILTPDLELAVVSGLGVGHRGK